MLERVRLSSAAGMLLATLGCSGGCGSSGLMTGIESGAVACPSQDEAHLFIDGAEAVPLKVLGGGGTSSPPAEASPDEASLILTATLASGDERHAFVNLRSLVAGSGLSPSRSSVEVRVYPAGGGAPSTSSLYTGAQLGGTLDVTSVAVQPGDAICGTFDLTGQGTPTVRVTGAFHHVWTGPMPGGG